MTYMLLLTSGGSPQFHKMITREGERENESKKVGVGGGELEKTK